MAKVFPVIMCGGSGVRLWPESQPAFPKQFLPLLGELSPFQETVLRVAPLAAQGGEIIVVAGAVHRAVVAAQLAVLGVEAQLIIEPVARDSGPAVTAAALWSARRCPEAINVIVASDHLVPDGAAFRRAAQSAGEAAASGKIVTLGVAPRSASSAYGYIRPAGSGLAPVERFVEKPDAETASSYVAEGYLWNSGNFIAPANTLLEEIDAHCPGMTAVVSEAIDAARLEPGLLELGAVFGKASALSFDYAVMEKTSLAAVLPVDFEWSDIGAWDVIAATGRGDKGRSVQVDCTDLLVRAPAGMTVITISVHGLAVIITPDGALVCPLDRAQDVKGAVEHLSTDFG
jgi:mannose-1-phosphate guanylyltransferase/mannose-6-phosphate isomerase